MNTSAIAVLLPNTINGAILTIAGVYGNGEARKEALKKDGFDPVEVQRAVNDLLPIINKYKE